MPRARNVIQNHDSAVADSLGTMACHALMQVRHIVSIAGCSSCIGAAVAVDVVADPHSGHLARWSCVTHEYS
jgi:hypothetical protein